MSVNVLLTVPAVFGDDLDLHRGKIARHVELLEPPYIGMKLLFSDIKAYCEYYEPVSVTDIVFDTASNAYSVITTDIRIIAKFLDSCGEWEYKYLRDIRPSYDWAENIVIERYGKM